MVSTQQSLLRTSMRTQASKKDSAASFSISGGAPFPPQSTSASNSTALESGIRSLNLAYTGHQASSDLPSAPSVAISELPGTESLPSLDTSRSTISSRGFSVSTSLASAPSALGAGTFDPETGEGRDLDPVPYPCWFDYLKCPYAFFHDIEEWKWHTVIHFRKAGPPLEGAECRLCPFKVGPDDLNGFRDLPLTHDEAATVKKLNGKARRSEKSEARNEPRVMYPFEYNERVVAQATLLWHKLLDHVAGHHHFGYGLSAARKDPIIIRYLFDVNALNDDEYKRLSSGDRIDNGGPVTSPGGSFRGYSNH